MSLPPLYNAETKLGYFQGIKLCNFRTWHVLISVDMATELEYQSVVALSKKHIVNLSFAKIEEGTVC